MAGHGTFIAGIIRAACPSARILSVPVMYGDGAADECDLVTALALLLRRHRASLDGSIEDPPLDIINLSLGYYHESPDSVSDSVGLQGMLRALSASGVTIVASAGNGGSDVEFWPAATKADHTGAPIVSVGSRNSGRPTVSHFSNTGPWVRTYQPGVGVVSTMPTTFNGAGQAGLLAHGPVHPSRGTPDVDDFSGGFGLWSGTSFSAPRFAGELARRMARGSRTGPRVSADDRSAKARALVDKICTKEQSARDRLEQGAQR
jgi:serine protease